MSRSLDFGFYPAPLDLQVGPVCISTLACLDETVERVINDEGVHAGWIYAPCQEVYMMGRGVETRPLASRVFGLPKTHRFEHSSASGEDQLTFHIWSLSFFTGIRLTATEAGFLDAASLKPGALVDFVLLGHSRERAVELTEEFWCRNAQPAPRLVSAIIHALFMAHNPLLLQFERFTYLYMAIDACFALAKLLRTCPAKLSHARRIAWMCSEFGLLVPSWADPAAAFGPEIAALRNQTFHEALFVGEPLGFSVHGITSTHNITLEMEALICRLLVALLGGKADFISSAVTSRQRHGLSLA